jgi:hypothetical protein
MMKRMTASICVTGTFILALAVPAAAQTFPNDPVTRSAEAEVQSQGEGLRNAAHTADTGAGEVGQRQMQDSVREPLGRLDSRIQNRIQNRIRNRVDRNYDPTANATSPFKEAEDQARESRRPKAR